MVRWMFACVTAGSMAPGVHERSGSWPLSRAWHGPVSLPVTCPGSCKAASPDRALEVCPEPEWCAVPRPPAPDCEAWRHVSSPDLGGACQNNALNGVATSSSTSIWAVGLLLQRHRGPDAGPPLLLIELTTRGPRSSPASVTPGV